MPVQSATTDGDGVAHPRWGRSAAIRPATRSSFSWQFAVQLLRSAGVVGRWRLRAGFDALRRGSAAAGGSRSRRRDFNGRRAAAAARSLARRSRILSTSSFSSFQRFSRPASRSRSLLEQLGQLDLGDAALWSSPTAVSRCQNLQLGLQGLDAPAAVIHLRRHGVLADGHARRGGVDQADRLVGQLAAGM